MQEGQHIESATEGADLQELAKRNASLSGRLEIYGWLFWAAMFFILVLLMVHYA
jgi:hypothetical protein